MINSGETASQASSEYPHSIPREGETFWASVYRRSRYVLATLLALAAFYFLGWHLLKPPAEFGGVSLLAWGSTGMIATLGAAAILMAVTALCTFLVHPDAPHMGLYCAILGMAGLSIRGGDIHTLLDFRQRQGTVVAMSHAFAVECGQWGLILLIAELFARSVHDRFFANAHWLLRSNADASRIPLRGTHLDYPVGVSLLISKSLRTDRVKGWMTAPLAMIWSGLVAWLMLYLFMQTQLKGQVLLACFVAFMVSTICGYMAFPRVPMLAMMMVVPLTAAAAYWYAGAVYNPGMHPPQLFPGQAPMFALRALPIDYMTMGVAGGILGFYWAVHWSLASSENDAAA